MTLGGVRDVYRTALKGVGLKEWTDGFNITNIPATLIDKSFHLDVGRVQMKTAGVNASAFEVKYPVVVEVFLKGFKHPAAAIDGALDLAQTIVGAVVTANKALNEQGLKWIVPVGLDTKPLQVSNTHSVILTMTFDSAFVMGF